MLRTPIHGHPVIFLLSTLEIGGSETKTVRLVNRLAQNGWPVHLLYLNAPSTLSRQLDKDVPCWCLNRAGRFSFGAMIRLSRYINRVGARTIVAVNLYPSLYAHAASILGPSVRIRRVVTVNTTDHLSRSEEARMRLYAPILRRAEHVIFGCQAQLEQWTLQYAIAADRCTVIYNGVDTLRFSPHAAVAESVALGAQLGFAPGDFVVGTVGQLRPEKAQGILIEAIALIRKAVPNVRALMVGNGSERSALEGKAEALGVADRVTFLGEVQDVRPALGLMSVFVLTSTAVETFSNAALEAMAMANPVILSNIGGAREMVADRLNGYIVPKAHVGQLAARLRNLAEAPELRHLIGLSARKAVEEHFSFSRMVRDFEAILS